MHDDPWEHGHFGAEDEVVFGSIAEDGFPINPDWLRLTSVGIDIGSSHLAPDVLQAGDAAAQHGDVQ